MDKCLSCDKNDGTQLHSCPYQEEINDNDDPHYCNCCGDCYQECVWGI